MLNEYEFRIFGMMRSGNHCIINWIASHFNKVCYFNNVLQYRNPLVLHNNNVFDIPEYQRLNKNNLYDDKECLIYSYEDIDPTTIKKEVVPNKIEAIGRSNNEYIIMILRDPLNLIASRFKSGLYKNTDAELWKSNAKESLNSQILDISFTILYDKWVIDQKYRECLASKFNKKNNDRTMGQIAWCGSSYKGNPRVLNRWDDDTNYLKEPKRWMDVRKKILSDTELLKLREEIFGQRL